MFFVLSASTVPCYIPLTWRCHSLLRDHPDNPMFYIAAISVNSSRKPSILLTNTPHSLVQQATYYYCMISVRFPISNNPLLFRRGCSAQTIWLLVAPFGQKRFFRGAIIWPKISFLRGAFPPTTSSGSPASPLHNAPPKRNATRSGSALARCDIQIKNVINVQHPSRACGHQYYYYC